VHRTGLPLLFQTRWQEPPAAAHGRPFKEGCDSLRSWLEETEREVDSPVHPPLSDYACTAYCAQVNPTNLPGAVSCHQNW